MKLFGHMIRVLPPGNGGFPRWHLSGPWQKRARGHYRTLHLVHFIVPRFQFCLWINT